MILQPLELMQAYAQRGRMAAFARDIDHDYAHVCSVMRGANKNPTYKLLRDMTAYAVKNKYCKITADVEIL